MDRALALVPMQALEALPTGALLARLARLRHCEETQERSDLSQQEIAAASHLILFKSDPRWRTAYSDLKALLAAREHAPTKP